MNYGIFIKQCPCHPPVRSSLYPSSYETAAGARQDIGRDDRRIYEVRPLRTAKEIRNSRQQQRRESPAQRTKEARASRKTYWKTVYIKAPVCTEREFKAYERFQNP